MSALCANLHEGNLRPPLGRRQEPRDYLRRSSFDHDLHSPVRPAAGTSSKIPEAAYCALGAGPSAGRIFRTQRTLLSTPRQSTGSAGSGGVLLLMTCTPRQRQVRVELMELFQADGARHVCAQVPLGNRAPPPPRPASRHGADALKTKRLCENVMTGRKTWYRRELTPPKKRPPDCPEKEFRRPEYLKNTADQRCLVEILNVRE